VRFFQPVGVKKADQNSMGIDIPILLMTGDLNSFVFEQEIQCGGKE